MYFATTCTTNKIMILQSQFTKKGLKKVRHFQHNGMLDKSRAWRAALTEIKFKHPRSDMTSG